MKEIYDKYRDGHSLTNKEVQDGIDFYGDLADKLFKCGDTFRLAAKEALQVYHALYGFRQARSEQRRWTHHAQD